MGRGAGAQSCLPSAWNNLKAKLGRPLPLPTTVPPPALAMVSQHPQGPSELEVAALYTPSSPLQIPSPGEAAALGPVAGGQV